jgi:hypothetical protein
MSNVEMPEVRVVHSMSYFFSKTSYTQCVYSRGCEAVMASEHSWDRTTLLWASAGAHRAAASTDRLPPAPGLTVRAEARRRQHALVCRLRSPGPGEPQRVLPWTAHRTRSVPAPRQPGPAATTVCADSIPLDLACRSHLAGDCKRD